MFEINNSIKLHNVTLRCDGNSIYETSLFVSFAWVHKRDEMNFNFKFDLFSYFISLCEHCFGQVE